MSDESAFGNIIGYRGRLGQRNTGQPTRETARQALYSLRPDPQQPRNLFGDASFEERLWNGEHPREILNDWLRVADVFPKRAERADALRHLAATIAEYGLIQPITYRALPSDMDAPNGVDKLVVTGERRWWAHVLLDLEDRDVNGTFSADTIKAIALPTDAKIRGIQLIENLSREGLNAVERAAGLNMLRDEMSAGRTKAVSWTEVEKRLGIDRAYRWRIQQVDKLSPAAKQLIVVHGITENAIRPITTNKQLQLLPDLQESAIQTLIFWQQNEEDSSNRRLTQYVTNLLNGLDETPAATKSKPDYATLAGKVISRVGATSKALSKLDDGGNLYFATAIANDKTLKNAISDLKKQLDNLLNEADVVGRQQ